MTVEDVIALLAAVNVAATGVTPSERMEAAKRAHLRLDEMIAATMRQAEAE